MESAESGQSSTPSVSEQVPPEKGLYCARIWAFGRLTILVFLNRQQIVLHALQVLSAFLDIHTTCNKQWQIRHSWLVSLHFVDRYSEVFDFGRRNVNGHLNAHRFKHSFVLSILFMCAYQC